MKVPKLPITDHIWTKNIDDISLEVKNLPLSAKYSYYVKNTCKNCNINIYINANYIYDEMCISKCWLYSIENDGILIAADNLLPTCKEIVMDKALK